MTMHARVWPWCPNKGVFKASGQPPMLKCASLNNPGQMLHKVKPDNTGPSINSFIPPIRHTLYYTHRADITQVYAKVLPRDTEADKYHLLRSGNAICECLSRDNNMSGHQPDIGVHTGLSFVHMLLLAVCIHIRMVYTRQLQDVQDFVTPKNFVYISREVAIKSFTVMLLLML